METVLRIAVQKSGRLSEKTQELLRQCGLDFNSGISQLKIRATNFPLEVLFLRDDDIPGYVADGVADIGVVGENVVDEKMVTVDTVHRLGFAKCRLSIAIPRRFEYTGTEFLAGKRIATSYPNILKMFLNEKGVSAEVSEISGSVEIAPAIGLTDAICDIVSTGSTLLANGLKEVESFYKSEAILIATPGMNGAKKPLLDKLVFRIKAVQKAKRNKYIILNAPNNKIEEISKILPGMKSPTVTPLALEGWSALYSVVAEDEFWEICEKLHEAGAEGILVVPIEKMIY
ncbi:MAG: ATP phosphoribosyltransferase [Salinivirgaceae bacterium]